MPIAVNTAMIAALREAAARAGLLQPPQLLTGEDRDQLLADARRLQPGYRVGQLVFGGQPFEELLQGTVLVAGVGAAVPFQQPGHPPLNVLAADLLPVGQAGQAGGGEPPDRLGVGLNRLSGLALGSQAQGERADLSLGYPGVQLPRMRSRSGHGHRLSLPWRTIGTQRYRRQQTAEPQQAKARLGLTADHIRARALRADVAARA
jgi:hypothetical protein